MSPDDERDDNSGGDERGSDAPDAAAATGEAASVVVIEGEMTIYRAQELKRTLLEGLGSSEICRLDLAGVTELDSAGVQLLMLVRQLAVAKQGQVRIVAHSPQVEEVLRLLNLTSYLEAPPPDSGFHEETAEPATPVESPSVEEAAHEY